VGEAVEAHGDEGFAPPLPGLSAQAADEVQDLAHGGVGRQVRLLRNVGEGPPRRHLVGPEIVAVDLHPAGVRPLHARRELQQGALAAAVPSQEEGEARPDLQVDSREDRLAR
jgi:hypothetical protein